MRLDRAAPSPAHMLEADFSNIQLLLPAPVPPHLLENGLSKGPEERVFPFIKGEGGSHPRNAFPVQLI